jgi:hypothetical protein
VCATEGKQKLNEICIQNTKENTNYESDGSLDNWTKDTSLLSSSPSNWTKDTSLLSSSPSKTGIFIGTG